VRVTQAYGQAEREAALAMAREIPGGSKRVTLAADRGYDTQGFVSQLREMNVTPHVAQNTSGRRSAVNGRTVRYEGYGLSQRARKRVEQVFGWMKTLAGMREGGMDGDAGCGGIQSGADEEPDGGGCVRRGDRGRKSPRNGPTGPEPGRRRGASTRFQAPKTASEKLKQKFKGQISAAC